MASPSKHEVPVLIEGVATDVIVLIVAIFVGFCSLIAWNFMRRNTAGVHPDNEEHVEDVRNRLRNDNANRRDVNTGNDVTNGRDVNNGNDVTNGRDVNNGNGVTNGLEARAAQRNEDNCAICLSDLHFSCETNCGHVFCGRCLITYWRFGTWLGPIHCPACRTQVTVLLECFTAEEIAANSEELRQIHADVSDYNRRFSGEPRSFMEHLRDAPTLLRHAFRAFFTAEGFLLMFRIRFFFALLALVIYIISPFDFLSEAAFGLLGYLDDAFVLCLFLMYISFLYRGFVHWRANWHAQEQ